MSLRLKSFFQAIPNTRRVDTGALNPANTDWQDVFDSVVMMKSEVADGASAVAHSIDTTTTYTQGKLLSIRNNGVEKMYVDAEGMVYVGGVALTTPPGGASGDYQYNSGGSFAGGMLKHLTADRVGLGGSTSAFPALKRSGTDVHVVLADDSNLARLNASYLYAQSQMECDGPILADLPGSAANPSVRVGGNAGHGIYSDASGRLQMAVSGVTRFWLEGSGLAIDGWIDTVGRHGFRSAFGVAADVALERNAAGVVEVNSGTLNDYRDLRVRTLTANSQVGAGGAPEGSWVLTARGQFPFTILNASNVAKVETTSGGSFWFDSAAILGWGTLAGSSDVALARHGAGITKTTNGGATDYFFLDGPTLTMKFGGTTASFPAFKRSTTELQVRLADDSAYAPFRASRLFADDGSAAAPTYTFTSATTTGLSKSGNGLTLSAAGVDVCTAWGGGAGGLLISSGAIVGFNQGTSGGTGFDVAFARDSAGVIQVNSGTVGTFRDLKARNIQSTGSVAFAGASTGAFYIDGFTNAWGSVSRNHDGNGNRFVLNATYALSWKHDDGGAGWSAAMVGIKRHAANVLKIFNEGGTDYFFFDGPTLMEKFGGTTSSFPAWKRSGTEIQARLADDSGYALLQSSTHRISTGKIEFEDANGWITRTAASNTIHFSPSSNAAAAELTAAHLMLGALGGPTFSLHLLSASTGGVQGTFTIEPTDRGGNGGAGHKVILRGGVGSTAGAGEVGGGLFLAGGAAGAGDKDGGNVDIDGGAKSGTGLDGAIRIAPTRGRISFFGVTPVDRSTGWAVTAGYTEDKAFDPETATLLETSRVLGTLVDYFLSRGDLGA